MNKFKKQGRTPSNKIAASKSSDVETVHFLHIGKAAGTQVRYLAKSLNKQKADIRINKHRHDVRLKDLPSKERYFFSIRQPESRFMSGFYSRKRKGQPRIYSEWSGHEKMAFGQFEHATDLAEALFEDSPRGHEAISAIRSITHTAQNQVDWFVQRGNFLNIRPPIYILRQEHFDTDWDVFLGRLALKDLVELESASDPVRAHRNDYDGIPPLSEKAKKNLAAWYVQDIEFYKQCEAWIAAQ